MNAEKRSYQYRRTKFYVGKEKAALNSLVIPPHKHPWKENLSEDFIVRKK